MSTPITVKHRTDDAEAMQFEGGIDSARDLAKWIGGSGSQRADVHLCFYSSLYEPSRLELRISEDEYVLGIADWIVRENGLFFVVRREDFPLRYVTAIEKIMIEAGLS